MKFSIKNVIYVSVISLLLIGCGSSNSDGTINNNESINGNVADGYLVGAKVCLDKNANDKCDSNEPSAITTKNGKYNISNVPYGDRDKYNLLVEISPNVIDEDDNQTVDKNYKLTAPIGETFVSPISSLVQRYMFNNDKPIAFAKEAIAGQLGISNSADILIDYIANTSIYSQEKLHAKAKLIASLKMDILSKIENTTDGISKKIVNKYIEDKIISKLPAITNMINTWGYESLTYQTYWILEETTLNDVPSKFYEIEGDIKEINIKSTLNNEYIDLNTSILEEDKKYKLSYFDSNITKFYTIKDSNDKTCIIYFLNTTDSYNEKSYSYSFNYSIVSNQNRIDLGGTNNNHLISMSWQKETNATSHVDFFAHCEVIPPNSPTNSPVSFLNSKYRISVPLFNDVEYNTQTFLSSVVKNIDSNISTDDNITFSNNVNDYTNSSWSEVSIFMNNQILKTYNKNTVCSSNGIKCTGEDVDRIEFKYDEKLVYDKKITFDVYNKQNIRIGGYQISHVEDKLNDFNETEVGYLMGKVENNKLIYTIDKGKF